jgi:hypothetical protein
MHLGQGDLRGQNSIEMLQNSLVPLTDMGLGPGIKWKPYPKALFIRLYVYEKSEFLVSYILPRFGHGPDAELFLV